MQGNCIKQSKPFENSSMLLVMSNLKKKDHEENVCGNSKIEGRKRNERNKID